VKGKENDDGITTWVGLAVAMSFIVALALLSVALVIFVKKR